VVPRGERGELCTRLQRDAGLLGRGRKTADVLDAQGWMHTGDIAIIDAEAIATSSAASGHGDPRRGGYPRDRGISIATPKSGRADFGVADVATASLRLIRTRPGETLTAETSAPCTAGSPATDPALSNSRRIPDDGDGKSRSF
jgi:fatty-acyl-CoA synthase